MLYFSKQRCFLFVSASIIWDDAIARRQRNTQFAHSIVYISAYLSLYHTTRHFSTDRKKNDEDDDVMLRDLYADADYGIRTNGSALIVVGRLWFCFDMLRAKVLINFLFCRCFFVVFFAYVN